MTRTEAALRAMGEANESLNEARKALGSPAVVRAMEAPRQVGARIGRIQALALVGMLGVHRDNEEGR